MENIENVSTSQDKNRITERSMADIDAAIARISSRLENVKRGPMEPEIVSVATKGKLIAAFVAMFITLFSMVFSSYAYFTATSSSSENRISSGDARVDIVDLAGAPGSPGTELSPIRVLPGQVEHFEIYANNIGNMPLYVRAKTVVNFTLSDRYASRQGEVDTSLVIFNISDESWKKVGDYYYYVSPLAVGQKTPEFFTTITFSENMGNIYKDSTITVKVVFEIVQASNNGDSVFDASGWATYAEGGAS